MKFKTIAITVGVSALVAALGTGLYFVTQRTNEVAEITPLEETSPLSVDYVDGETASNANIVLDDQSEALKKAQEESAIRTNTEKANGTGDDAPIETSYDLAYAQQLAQELGAPMPSETVSMIAVTQCNVRADATTESAVVSVLKKGDKVNVAEVGDWNKIVFDDGTEGYVRSDLLKEEVETPEVAVPEATPVPEASQPVVETPAVQEPAPAPSQSNAGAANPNLTTEEALRILQQAGGGISVEQTGEMYQYTIDPNAAANSGVDLSGVTLH